MISTIKVKMNYLSQGILCFSTIYISVILVTVTLITKQLIFLFILFLTLALSAYLCYLASKDDQFLQDAGKWFFEKLENLLKLTQIKIN